MDSPFEVLGIDPNADEAEIDRAYRRRVKEAHPDQGGSSSEFQSVYTAYERIQSGEERGAEHESVGDPREEEKPQVEYLNYEVLDDRGWDLDDADLFEKASVEGLDPADHGQIPARSDEFLLEAAEGCGFAWPYACRGGACANCAVAVLEGEMEMPANHVLPSDMIERGIRLSCIGTPTTDEMKVVYNVKQMPGLDELRLPARKFGRASLND